MPKFKELKQIQRKVNRQIHGLNRNLKEDCFAGRFSVKMIKRKDEFLLRWPYPKFFIEIMDNEQPERNIVELFHWSDSWGLREFETLIDILNNFIVSSDFWDRWRNDEAYRETHFFSGKRMENLKNVAIKTQEIINEREKNT